MFIFKLQIYAYVYTINIVREHMITFKSQIYVLFSNVVLSSGNYDHESLNMTLSTYKVVLSGRENVPDYLSVTLSTYS